MHIYCTLVIPAGSANSRRYVHKGRAKLLELQGPLRVDDQFERWPDNHVQSLQRQRFWSWLSKAVCTVIPGPGSQSPERCCQMLASLLKACGQISHCVWLQTFWNGAAPGGHICSCASVTYLVYYPSQGQDLVR